MSPSEMEKADWFKSDHVNGVNTHTRAHTHTHTHTALSVHPPVHITDLN